MPAPLKSSYRKKYGDLPQKEWPHLIWKGDRYGHFGDNGAGKTMLTVSAKIFLLP